MRRVLPVLLILAAPVAAQETFSLPQGCDAYLTTQKRDCTVTHHFYCAGDPDGHQRRVDLTEEGLVYAGTIDAETQWIQSFHALAGHIENLEPGPADPANMTELMTTGLDTYDFRTFSRERGTTRYVGQDRLTGEVVVIDGVALHRTEFQITAYTPDGSVLWQSEGREFVSEDYRMFLSGQSDVTAGGESWQNDGTPVEFVFPDEPGFLSAEPKHGCGLMMSLLEIE